MAFIEVNLRMTQRNNTHHSNEMLSALMDGELTELELHRVLKEVHGDVEARETWARYQLVGSVMRGDDIVVSPFDLSGRVMAALDDEPALKVQDAAASNKKVGLLGNVTRFAVAASVASLAVFGVQQLQTGTGTPQVAEADVTPVESAADMPMGLLAPDFPAMRNVSAGDLSGKQQQQQPVVIIPIKGASPGPELQAYLNGLMLEHAEHTANTGTGMLPFARIPRIDKALESAQLSADNADNSMIEAAPAQ